LHFIRKDPEREQVRVNKDDSSISVKGCPAAGPAGSNPGFGKRAVAPPNAQILAVRVHWSGSSAPPRQRGWWGLPLPAVSRAGGASPPVRIVLRRRARAKARPCAAAA